MKASTLKSFSFPYIKNILLTGFYCGRNIKKNICCGLDRPHMALIRSHLWCRAAHPSSLLQQALHISSILTYPDKSYTETEYKQGSIHS